MEDAEFDGRSTRVEKTTFQRLVAAAEHHHRRRGRPVFPGLPEQTISDWLDDLERERVSPGPSPELGDLAVKLRRGEFWMYTADGWWELGPVQLVECDVPEDAGLLGERGAAHNVTRQVATDEPHSVAYETRFFGRSVIEDELERIRGSLNDIGRGEIRDKMTARQRITDEVREDVAFAGASIEVEFDRLDLHKQAHVAAAELLAAARRQAEDELENDVIEALTDWLAHRNNQRDDT